MILCDELMYEINVYEYLLNNLFKLLSRIGNIYLTVHM